MRESTFTASIGRLLPVAIYRLKLSLRFAKGVADSWYSGPERDLWVEWKYLPKLPRTIKPLELLSANQIDWLRGRHAEGRNVAVIIGCQKTGLILPGLSWEAEFPKEDYLENCVPKREIARWIENIVSAIDIPAPSPQAAKLLSVEDYA